MARQELLNTDLATLRRPTPGSSAGRDRWLSPYWWNRARAVPPTRRPSPRPSWRTCTAEPGWTPRSWTPRSWTPQGPPAEAGGPWAKTTVCRSYCCEMRVSLKSEGLNFLSLGALGTLGDLELHALCLFERTVAARLDRGVVNEHVRSAAILGDEAEALFSVEPLNCALNHEE